MKFIDTLNEIKKAGVYTVIPDIKCFSPKEGDLLRGRNPVDVAVSLVEAGAPVLSVVTEPKEFKGSMELLKSIVKACNVPVLRKDFVYTREDLIETKEAGASAILLMCSCLTKEEMRYLYTEAQKLGLDPLVETHTKEELVFASQLGAKLVGINNRNILELERDDGTVSRTKNLAFYAPKDAILISESSIQSPEEVRMAMDSGADIALVGTALWRARDTALFYRMLCSSISVKICGLKRQGDMIACMENGVERLGFVVEYPVKVPWNLSREEAKQLVSLVLPPYKSCIVTGGKAEDIIDLAREVKPSMVQLHYHEGLEDTKLVAEALDKEGIEVIKTFPLTKEEQLFQFGTSNIEEIVEALCETKISAILVDGRGPENASNSGTVVDYEVYQKIKKLSSKEVILAGGINLDNVGDIIKKGAKSIDLMTGVESMPGEKEIEKIKILMNRVREEGKTKGE